MSGATSGIILGVNNANSYREDYKCHVNIKGSALFNDQRGQHKTVAKMAIPSKSNR